LDFFIVVTSLIDLALEGVDLPIIKILRLLRTLRPLRFISHNSEMKMVVVALFSSIGGIFYVAIVIIIVWMMFAILAVNLFGGRFQYCSIEPYQHHTELECLLANGEWQTYDSNFDSVPQAMLSLFVIASLEGWPDIMYQAVDATGVEKGPVKEASPQNAYFFIIFILVGSFLFLNLFVGVIFMNFLEAEKEDKESQMLSESQQKWVDILKMIISATPDLETTTVPTTPFRQTVHRFVASPGQSTNKFDIFIMACIVLNMIQMAMIYEGSSPSYLMALEIVNYIFTAIFVVEAALKLIAFGKHYFRNSWNVFDFVVVIASLIDIMMGLLDQASLKFLRVGPQLARVLRVLRVSRLFRLINKFKGLQALIETITFSLPQLFNVFALLMLLFFIFSVLGTFLFREVTEGDVIDSYTNFSNFGFAMLILMRISTGEDWNRIMYDLTRTGDDCIPEKTCGTQWAVLFFLAFIVLCSFVMLNLFILVILQQFELYYLPEENVIKQFKNDLEVFKEKWTIFSREHRCLKIKDSKLVKFFASMEEPLGMSGQDVQEIIKNIVKMDLQSDDEGFVYFNELLYKTMRRVYGEEHVVNKKLAEQEIKAMRRIQKITDNLQKKSRSLDKQGNVNPFLSMMYHRMSFKAWMHQWKEHKEKREYEFEMGNSKEYSDEDGRVGMTEEEPSVYTDETISVQTLSDSEEEDPMSSNRLLIGQEIQIKDFGNEASSSIESH